MSRSPPGCPRHQARLEGWAQADEIEINEGGVAYTYLTGIEDVDNTRDIAEGIKDIFIKLGARPQDKRQMEKICED